MTTQQNAYKLLVFLTLVSFGFFGSLSHIFSRALIILILFNQIRSQNKFENSLNAKLLFIILTSPFFLLFLTSCFRTDFGLLIQSISPMAPMPCIGLMIIFHSYKDFKISAKKVAQFSQISVAFSLAIYLLLSLDPEPSNYFQKFNTDRVKLFSGNSIPFSFALMGVSLFCLADWRNSTVKSKVLAFLIFSTGIYLSSFLSLTRGTLLSFLVITPIIIFHLLNKFLYSFIAILTLVLIGLSFHEYGELLNWKNAYFQHIKNGFDTLTSSSNTDGSVQQRLDMWSAAFKAISEAPLVGHGVTNRFIALKPYLPVSAPTFTHPHNDILASIISSGLLGGLIALLSLLASFIASLTTPFRSPEKLCFGLMTSCAAMVSANVSTVFFNDISSAWLAFTTYLILVTDFSRESEKLA